MKLSSLLLPAFGAATQIPLQTEQIASNLTISKARYNDLEELARIVDITYCVGIPGSGLQKPFECASRCKDFDNFELVTTWNTGPFLSDSCGFIALSHAPGRKRIIVAFRGTYSIASTIADLTTIPQQYEPYPGESGNGSDANVPKCVDCTVHMGFNAAWRNTKDLVLPDVRVLTEHHGDYDLVLIGHSLGGAIAALAGLDLLARGYEPTVTTFGEPRLGNQAFAEYVDSRFQLTMNNTSKSILEASKFRRVTHVNDPVPLLPFEEWGYMPHGGEIYIAAQEVPPKPEDVYHCIGPMDGSCSQGSPERGGKSGVPWGISARFRIWELLFAHRDYFWRIGLCVADLNSLWPAKITIPLQRWSRPEA